MNTNIFGDKESPKPTGPVPHHVDSTPQPEVEYEDDLDEISAPPPKKEQPQSDIGNRIKKVQKNINSKAQPKEKDLPVLETPGSDAMLMMLNQFAEMRDNPKPKSKKSKKIEVEEESDEEQVIKQKSKSKSKSKSNKNIDYLEKDVEILKKVIYSMTMENQKRAEEKAKKAKKKTKSKTSNAILSCR